MFAIPNQSSVPKAYTQFTDAKDADDGDDYLRAEGGSRLMPSGNCDRLVDCMEEFVKYTLVMRQHFDLFSDRYSERVERESKRVKDDSAMRERDIAGQEGNVKTVANAGFVNGVDVGGI